MTTAVNQDYDSIFNSDAKAAIALTPDEAVFAIGSLMLTLDPNVSDAEQDVIDDFLRSLDLQPSVQSVIRRKIDQCLVDAGPGALFNAAKQGLSTERAVLTALDLAVNVALADNHLKSHEEQYLAALAQALQVPGDELQEIIFNYVDDITPDIDDEDYDDDEDLDPEDRLYREELREQRMAEIIREDEEFDDDDDDDEIVE